MSMRIGVDYGSHSHLMLPIIDRYKNAIEKVRELQRGKRE